MARPKLLDLFCGAGGAAMGYHRAGFDVYGVDINPQPNYPFKFRQGDALDVLRKESHRFDAVHASPPCQAYSLTWQLQGNEHPQLIEPLRNELERISLPYVIENVPGAPLLDPIELCGCMFPPLHTYRPRLFEPGGGFSLTQPAHRPHSAPTVKMGRPLREGDWYHAVGNFSNVAYVRRDMGVEWMTRDGIRECIPPAYTQYIGAHLLGAVAERAA